LADDYEAAIKEAGFVDVTWTRVSAASLFDSTTSDPTLKAGLESLRKEDIATVHEHLWSYQFSARKK